MQQINSSVGRIRINVHLLLTQHTNVSTKSCSFVVLHLRKRNLTTLILGLQLVGFITYVRLCIHVLV